MSALPPLAAFALPRPVAVEGLGCAGSFGTDPASLAAGLASPLVSVEEGGLAAKTDTSSLNNFLPARTLRQTDHFTRMALLAALRALQDAGVSPDAPGTGIVLASGYGPAAPTFQFLDSLIEHGEAMASPLAFSHSVHNIPAASIALKLGIAGPCATICQMESSVASAFTAAFSWLAEGRVERVLFGAADEHTPLLARVSRRLAAAGTDGDPSGPPGTAHSGVEKSAAGQSWNDFARRHLPIGEGAAFFCLSLDAQRARRGRINGAGLLGQNPGQNWRSGAYAAVFPSCRLILVSGVPPKHAEFPTRTGAECAPQAGAGRKTLCAARAYGNIPVAQAFDLALLAGGAFPGIDEAACLNFSPQGYLGALRFCAASAESARPDARDDAPGAAGPSAPARKEQPRASEPSARHPAESRAQRA